MAGTIHPSGSLLLRSSRGDAEAVDGRKYEFSTTLHGQPCIRSEKSGKYFVVSWEELLQMAIDAGIDNAEVPDAA